MVCEDLAETYRRLVADPQQSLEDLSLALGSPLHAVEAAVAELHAAGILETVDGPPFRLIDPRTALARLATRAEGELARGTAQLAQLRRDLDDARRRHEEQLDRTTFLIHHTGDQVRDRLAHLADTATVECLSLNPGRVHHPKAMDASKPLNQLALERGVTIRSIYQESFILDADTLAYGRWLEGLGGEVRTVPQVPQRLVIVDQHTAILGIRKEHRDDGVALEITNASLVDILLRYFNDLWDTARPFTVRPHRSGPNIEDPLTKRLLELLADGATDDQAARTLGLSDRTVRRLVAGLMKDLGTTSRLQTGVQAVQRGWL